MGRGGLLRVTFAFLQNPAEPGTASRGNGSPRPWKKLFCRIPRTHAAGICPLPGLAPKSFPQPLMGSSGASGGPVWFLQVPSSWSLLQEPPRGPCPGTSGRFCKCWAAAGSPGMAEPRAAWLGTMPTSAAVTFSSSVSRPGVTAQLYFGRHSSVFTGTPLNLGCCWGGQHYSCARCFRGARTRRAAGDTRNGPAEVPGGLGVPWVPPEPGATRRGTAPCLETGSTLRSPPHGGGSGTGAVPPPYRAWGDAGDISTIPTGPPQGAHHHGG